MRLIDADKLPIRSIDETDLPKDKGLLVVLKEDIDHSPTVKPCYQTTSCLDCKNYDKENYYCPRFCEVIREATKEIKRSQGKWEEPFEHNGKMYHKCNQCHISSPFMLIDNYCSYCGAKMQKGGKENERKD